MHLIIFLNSTSAVPQAHTPKPHTPSQSGGWPSAVTQGSQPGGCHAHQELLALLLFGGTKCLIVLQILLQDLQPGLQELLRKSEKEDTVGRGFWQLPLVPS